MTGHRFGNRLLAALPAEGLTALEPYVTDVSLQQGARLCEPGRQIDSIIFPHSGLISLVTVMAGAALETGIIGREGALGLTSLADRRALPTRAQVQVPGLFSVVPAARLAEAMKDHSALRTWAMDYLEELLAEAQQAAFCNAIHDAGSRLCRWMLQIADRLGNDTLPFTQEELSQLLGVRRTTVTVLAQALMERGLIK